MVIGKTSRRCTHTLDRCQETNARRMIEEAESRREHKYEGGKERVSERERTRESEREISSIAA